MKILYDGWLFLVCLLVLATCKDHSREVVDKQYLQSPDFTEFEQQTNEEKKQKIHQRKTLQANLQLLPQCNAVNEFSLPLELKETEFPGLLKNHGCNVLKADSLGNMPIKLLGKSHFRDADTYFVLVDNEILSSNRQLLTVTFNGSHMLDYKVVGAYKKSISKQITTDIKLEYDGEILKLTSKMVRNIKYPIEQNYTITTQYEIDGKGKISQI